MEYAPRTGDRCLRQTTTRCFAKENGRSIELPCGLYFRAAVRRRKGLPLGQLVVVSNRVAIPEKSASARAGGLEVAVNAALRQRPGIWFGWSGRIATHGTITAQRTVDKDVTYPGKCTAWGRISPKVLIFRAIKIAIQINAVFRRASPAMIGYML
jgi:hypothetical protein